MSLETAIEKLADSIATLAAAVTAGNQRIGDVIVDALKSDAKKKPAAKDPAPPAAPATTGQTTTAPAAAPAAPAVTLTDLQGAGASLIEKGQRDALVELIKATGAPDMSKLTPAQYPGLLAAMQAKLAELAILG